MGRKREKIQDIVIRYTMATIGMAFVALGVAFSIKSDMGTAPISCPPYVLDLWIPSVTVGEFTMIVNASFILIQLALLRKNFKKRYLMQIPAIVVFGLLTDAAIWACSSLPVPNYSTQIVYCLLTVFVTALGVSVELFSKAWMLSGDLTTHVISEVSGVRFSKVKVAFDITMVVISIIFALIVFHNPFGAGSNDVVIREGTLVLALFTGVFMKHITDPIVKRLLAFENSRKENRG